MSQAIGPAVRVCTIPVQTVSALNVREHFRVRAKRVKAERRITAAYLPLGRPPIPLVVSLTRLSVGELDDDNLRGALKGVRDQIAAWLGIDDRDPRVEWRYAQGKAPRGTYAVRVQFEEVP